MVRMIMTLLLVSFLNTTFSQDNNIDALAASIPDKSCTSVDALSTYIRQNFNSDSARLRAIYVWIANHISYDVALFHKIESSDDIDPQPPSEVLSDRRAVCEGYSKLFVELCKAADINAVQVSGYTKKDGRIATVSHAWVAAQLNGQWYLFDPTWAAGYVKDDRFTRSFSNDFYKVQPDKFIADHMPFDPMYQFLSYPLTNKEFTSGTAAGTKTVFNYTDSITQFKSMGMQEQWSSELRRLEAAGIQNNLLLKRKLYLTKNLQSMASKDVFEEAGKNFNAVLTVYKDYLSQKYKQFAGVADNAIRQQLDSMEYYIKQARGFLSQAVAKTDAQRQAKTGNMSNIERLWTEYSKEKSFAQQYLAADENGRKQLFRKR